MISWLGLPLAVSSKGLGERSLAVLHHMEQVLVTVVLYTTQTFGRVRVTAREDK